MIRKKKQLEMVLQSIPIFNEPKADLEQYQTPANIAADLLWNAYVLGDIEHLKVVDLGCGTGIFTIGSALLNAAEVIGIDADPDAVNIARQEVVERGLDEVASFITADIGDVIEKADTVFQNPPFGAQKAHRKEADRLFMMKALEIAPVVYSFHLQETEGFVKKFFHSQGGLVTDTFYYNFPLPKLYDFHQKESITVEVVVLRVERIE